MRTSDFINSYTEESEKKGLYYYVNKRKKAGTSRSKNNPKAPSAQDWKNAAKTAKNESADDRDLFSSRRANPLEEPSNPVASSIVRRIFSQRPDLLQHGPEAVGNAVDEVADWVGEVDEIGSSDVSGWVRQVERILQGNQGSLNEYAVDDGSGDEDDVLLKYARMWYQGDDATQQQVEQILDRMGWEIGEIESEEGGCFVVQAGDEDGRSYIGFAPADLSDNMDEEWSQKYKDSINCSHPKGFSQRAHCAGKKKHSESVAEGDDEFAPSQRAATSIATSGWRKGGEMTGTSLKGYIETTYDNLVSVFGEPVYGPTNDPYDKVTCEWIISFKDGTVATIYDYKTSETPLEMYDWHIGGNNNNVKEYIGVLMSGKGDIKSSLWEGRTGLYVNGKLKRVFESKSVAEQLLPKAKTWFPDQTVELKSIAEDATGGASCSSSVSAVVGELGEGGMSKRALNTKLGKYTNIARKPKQVKVKGGY